MRYELSTLKGLKRKLDIHLSAEQVQKSFDEHYKKKQQKAELAGFRKGKVPLSQIRALYQGEVTKDVAFHLINEFYSEVLEREKLWPASEPEINLQSPCEEGQPFEFSVVLEVQPEVKIDSSFRACLSKSSHEVKEEEVDRYIEDLRKMSAKKDKKKETLPTLPTDDELIKTFKCKDIKDLKVSVRYLLEREKKREVYSALRTQVLEQLIEQNPIPHLPERAVEHQKQNIVSTFESYLKSKGLTEKEIEEKKKSQDKNWQEKARFMVCANYLVFALARELNISISPQEVRAYLQTLSQEKNPPQEEYENIRKFLIREKTIGHLIDTAEPA